MNDARSGFRHDGNGCAQRLQAHSVASFADHLRRIDQFLIIAGKGGAGADIVTNAAVVVVVHQKNVHGGGGHNFKECTEEAFRTAVAAHLKHGATTIFPTLSSSPIENIYKAVSICEKLMAEKDSTVLGLHIEGPYLNPKMAGSLYDVKNPDKEEYIPLLESTNCIKRWDVSPELPGAHEFAQYLITKGILPALTHTEAEYDEIKAAYTAGFTHAAQFYNAMPGFHKRREYKYEGTVESVFLIDDMTVEVIADGKHLPGTILRLVYKLKGVERTCLVTDALSYAASDVKPEFVRDNIRQVYNELIG